MAKEPNLKSVKKARKKASKDAKDAEEIKSAKAEITKEIKVLEGLRKARCYAFLGQEITKDVVDEVFTELRSSFKGCKGTLDVIVDSGGGEIDAAYNLAMLFRKYGTKSLNFLVPRWAKSAATLLVCSGDSIVMSPVAELGPLDPQITQLNPLEKRLEHFSPLHIESTLELIREEFEEGNEKLARGLVERLQFPLTLGSFIKYHEIGQQYLVKLLESRMKLTGKLTATPVDIATRLTKGYADHGFCINVDEARSIGLNAVAMQDGELECLWKIHTLNKKIEAIQTRMREEKIREMIKELPPGLLDKLPAALQQDLRDLTKSVEGGKPT